MIISYAKIPLSVDIAAVKKEVSALNTNWKAHFNTFNYTGEWTVIALRSPGGSEQEIIPDLINSDTYRDTILLEKCAEIRKLLDCIKCEILSVRLLNLKSGAVIKEHKDAELSFEKGEARLHFPIFTNAEVQFYVEEKLVTMEEGDCWYINANRKHKVANLGATDRIHLVIDCKVNAWVEKLFEVSDKTFVAPDIEMMDSHKIISQLRQMGTDTSLAMATEIEKKLLNG